MSRSVKKASAKSATGARVRIYVADEFRQEQSGKVAALGLYSDNVLVLNVPESLPGPTKEQPIALDTLCVLVSIAGLKGSHQVGIALLDEQGQHMAGPFNSRAVDFPSEESAGQLITRFRPLFVSSFGVKRFVVTIDEQEHSIDIEVRRGALVSDQSEQLQQAQGPKATRATSRVRAKKHAPARESNG